MEGLGKDADKEIIPKAANVHAAMCVVAVFQFRHGAIVGVDTAAIDAPGRWRNPLLEH